MTLQEKLDLLKDLLVPGRITDAEYDPARMSVLDGKTTVEVLARFSRRRANRVNAKSRI